jgi:hypothetical protein
VSQTSGTEGIGGLETTAGDCLAVNAILTGISYQTIEEALCSVDRTNRRTRDFPDHLVVQFVVLMALFMELSYLHVFKKIRDALQLLNPLSEMKSLTDSALVQARQRVGSQPLKVLFGMVARPLADVFYGSVAGLRPVLIDGSIFDVEDTKENEQFGRPSNQAGGGAYPQVRCVVVIEYVSRAIIDVAFGALVGTSEQSLAKLVLSRLKPDMLCLGDRLYASFQNCAIVTDVGAHFLFRVKSDIKLRPEQELKDGSYMAKLYAWDKNGKRIKDKYRLVRVIEYKLKNGSERYRLITDLDVEQATASDLAKLYPTRWEVETVTGEIKAVLRKPRIVLRSKSPDMVLQELYGMFIAHFLIRRSMFEAAMQQGIPPNTLSFKHAVIVIKDRLSRTGDSPPE